MLPTPEIRLWSSSCRLTPDVAAPHPARRTRRRRTPGRAGRGRCGRSPAAARRHRRRPTGRRTSAGRRTAARTSGVSRTSRTRRCRSSGAPGGWTSICPLMPRWPSSASPLSSGSQKYLPRRRAPSIRRPVSAAAKPSGPRGSRRTGRGCSTSTRVMVRADDVPLEAGADDLDLGQLGHQSAASAAASAAARRAGSGTSRFGAISPYAVSAAACSASFLERPTPLP